jgi:hypothetical protein
MHVKCLILLIFIFILGLELTGCFPASRTRNDESETETTTETEKETTTETTTEVSDVEEADGVKILGIAESERENQMYKPGVDSTYLYWLNNKLILLDGSTKCNIFALNVLHKSGYKTPSENALTRDLVDTDKFRDILPVVGIQDATNAKKGDLVVWNGHVIIFESLTKIKSDLYAVAWWAGTRQSDNGENIKNNVCYGKYKLNGYYIVRRPIRK